MKRFLLTLLTFALIAGALVLALRPVAIEQLRLWKGARAVSGYRKAADALDTLDCGTRLALARENSGLPENGEALDALDLNGDGVVALLSIPKLGGPIPIYREDIGDVLEKGVVRGADAGLPVGGEGARCALYGERKGRFAGLDRLIPGDCFYIEAIQDTLIYEVTQVLDAGGEAFDAEAPDGEADLCTLIAGSADASEGNRLIVRASRVDRRDAPLADDTQPLPDWAARGILALPAVIVGLMILTVVEALRRGARRRRIKRTRI